MPLLRMTLTALLVASASVHAQVSGPTGPVEPRKQADNNEQVPCLQCPPPGTLPPSFEAYLKASDTLPNERFGNSLALSGNTLAVGAYGAHGSSGRVYVFVHDGSSWSQQAQLQASNSGTSDLFGADVALDGDTLVVGAPNEKSNGTSPDNNSVTQAGAAYVFERVGTTWTETAYLKAPLNTNFLHFGANVAVAESVIAVAAPMDDSDATGLDGDPLSTGAKDSGAVYTYVPDGATWKQESYIKASDASINATFGSEMAMHGDTLLVGAPDRVASIPGPGKAYVFVRDGDSWVEQAILQMAHGDIDDRFGESLALWGDTAVIGAPGENSKSLGTNGDETDNSALGPGAAFVFERTGSTWEQVAYLKPVQAHVASGLGWSPFAGNAVAIRGNRIAVSALDGSYGVGLRRLPSPLGKALSEVGAYFPGGWSVQLFERNNACWDHVGYAKGINTRFGNAFGTAVALDADALLVGMPGESSAATGTNGDAYDISMPGAGAVFSLDLDAVADTGAWSFEGCSLAGEQGPAFLDGLGSGAPGSDNLLVLSNARPFAALTLFVANDAAATAFMGGVLLPFPALGLAAGESDAAGAAEFPLPIPPGVPSGTETWAQVVIEDGFAPGGVALSNAVKSVTP